MSRDGAEENSSLDCSFEMCIKLRSNNTSEIWELLEDNNCNKVNRQKTQQFYPMVRPMPTPRCGDLLRSRVALNLSQVIQRSNLSTTIFFLISSFPFVRNLHKLESLTLTQLISSKTTRVKGEVENTWDKTSKLAATHAHKWRERSKKTAQRCYS